MTTLTLELPPDLDQRLHAEAERLGKPPQTVVQEWLAERLALTPPPAFEGEREKVRRVLQEAGLLAELGPGLRRRAENSRASLEQVRAFLSRPGGQPLSKIVLEQRRSKDW